MTPPKFTRRTLIKQTGLLAGGLAAGRVLPTGIAHAVERSAAQQPPRPLLMAHYMPWYQTPEISGYWGWHWTMDHFDPATLDADGRPQIAAHHMPLTGPYDSGDPVVLEYQTLLMALSGIDGVIVDWYGIEDYRDYAVLNESTNRLFGAVKAAGLKFAICYEDATVKHMVEEGHFAAEEALAHGQDVMRYMHAQWFTDGAYLKHEGRPVLFTFGPQYFKSSSDWQTLLGSVELRPALVTLDNHSVLDALASYPWPPMKGGIEYNRAAIEAYLSGFYRKARRNDYLVGGAFPGFHDIYAEAGARDSYGYLDAEGGETFRYTMQMALDQNPDVIQLITWNDYGEGTIIEPTDEFGYQYLEMVQDVRHAMPGSDFAFTADDLRLPLRLFALRKAHPDDDALNAALDAAAAAIVAGNPDAAAAMLDGLPGA